MNELDQKTVEIKTSCRDCIFAQFNDDVSKQIGCGLNRLEKFQEKNRLTKKVDGCTGLAYYEIVGICNACRNPAWASKFENKEERIQREIETQVDFIVTEGDTVIQDFETDLFNTVTSLVEQTVKPKKIVLIFRKKKYKAGPLLAKLDKLTKPAGIKYELVNVIDNSNLIDHAIKKCNGQFYTCVETGFLLTPTFIERINKLVNEDLSQFSMIEPVSSNLSGLTVQRLLHVTIGGNHGMSVVEKIKELAKNQNVPHMVKNWSIISESKSNSSNS